VVSVTARLRGFRLDRSAGADAVFAPWDGDLDKPMGEVIERLLPGGDGPFHPPLQQHLKVNRAPIVFPETIMEGVAELVEFEMIAAPMIGAIEKRAVVGLGLLLMPAQHGLPP
jgi:hypothetical protein